MAWIGTKEIVDRVNCGRATLGVAGSRVDTSVRPERARKCHRPHHLAAGLLGTQVHLAAVPRTTAAG